MFLYVVIIPVVFQDHRPYAICAFIGGWVMIGVMQLGLEPWIALLAGATSAAGLRLLALILDWRIPPWPRDIGS